MAVEKVDLNLRDSVVITIDENGNISPNQYKLFNQSRNNPFEGNMRNGGQLNGSIMIDNIEAKAIQFNKIHPQLINAAFPPAVVIGPPVTYPVNWEAVLNVVSSLFLVNFKVNHKDYLDEVRLSEFLTPAMIQSGKSELTSGANVASFTQFAQNLKNAQGGYIPRVPISAKKGDEIEMGLILSDENVYDSILFPGWLETEGDTASFRLDVCLRGVYYREIQ